MHKIITKHVTLKLNQFSIPIFYIKKVVPGNSMCFKTAPKQVMFDEMLLLFILISTSAKFVIAD